MTNQINFFEPCFVDCFAGGGGWSTGAELALGRPMDIAINHDPDAVLMHKTNHPFTRHYCEDIYEVDPREAVQGRHVAWAHFSPDCKHFSKAKGGKPVSKKIRGLAWVVLKWAALVRPDVISLENVEEFQTWGPVKRGKPVKSRSGETFVRWKSQLEALGYKIEHRELIAADYGAPTTRKRFFLIARCDGKPIAWPEHTHSKDGSDGKPKWISAAQIIDWSIPCPSVFATKAEIKAMYGLDAVRPLADKTMRRIARGVDKFVLKSPQPFIIQVNHGGENFRGQDIKEPMPTVTGKHGYGIAQPVLAPYLTQYHTEKSEKVRGQSVKEPIMTIDAAPRYALAAASISKFYGGIVGSDIKAPLPAVTSIDHNALEMGFLSEWYGNAADGISLAEPMRTQTSKDREALTAVHVCKFKGQDIGQSVDMPLQTITTSAGEFAAIYTTVQKYRPEYDTGRWPDIRAMLNKYCGYNLTDNEILLMVIDGAAYYLSDIGLRMLTPRELYAANGFPPDYIIDHDYTGKAYSKTKQVARCGNAVPPPFATAIVRANAPEYCGKPIQTMAELNDAIAI